MSGSKQGITRGARRGEGNGQSQILDLRLERETGRRLVAWFEKNSRALPWRVGAAGERDPYLVLVSETMLQQTQVSRVLERFPAFMRRFPTIAKLAAAEETEVLAEWSGMGYYRRAKNLHAAARIIVGEFAGVVPRGLGELRILPGVGRYTAGAIASIAFGEPAAIVDGNVARVLLRVHGRDAASDDKRVQAWLWERAGALAAASKRPGAVNEALMELGAMVCVPPPSAPRCERCPLRSTCAAFAAGRQMQIPRAKARAKQRIMHCGTAVVRRDDGSVLVEQRPAKGMWAGMWQAPTVESLDAPVAVRELAAAIGISAKLLKPEASFEHQTTHRRVVFRVWRAEVGRGFAARRGVWMDAGRVERMGMSNAQRRVLLEGVAGGTLWS